MAKSRKSRRTAPAQLAGADEFLGKDPEAEAIEKISAARAQAEKERPDNGGPILDEAAWRRAANELVAEQIEIDELMSKVAGVRGRISSIKKVAEKCGADWDVIKVYAKYAKRIRIGETGEVVTEQRRLAALMKLMDCPLHTQFGMFPEPPQEGAGVAKTEDQLIAEATLAGEHAALNGEPKDNCPHPAGSPKAFGWRNGYQIGADKLEATGGAPTARNGASARADAH